MNEPLLSVDKLCKFFPVRNSLGWRVGELKALNEVSFTVAKGEVLGIVGESGCGKSTLGKTLIGVHRPMSGGVKFRGKDIGYLSPSKRRKVARNMQYIYQDPGASLDPRWKIGTSMHEPLIIHTDLDHEARKRQIHDVMSAVSLPLSQLDQYPHELSGGQQRRIGLARILTLQPSLIILDEPTSGLDVSVQATILKLFQGLRKRFNLTYLFISHDLNVINAMCDRVAVMYLGEIIELGETADIFNNPKHPYTQLLLSSIPKIGVDKSELATEIVTTQTLAPAFSRGCKFSNRCTYVMPVCSEKSPTLNQVGGRQIAACFKTNPNQ